MTTSASQERSFVTVSADGFATYWCPFCGGVSHPATGCEYRDGYVVCHGCTRSAWRWTKGWTNKKAGRGKPCFYTAAARFQTGHGIPLGRSRNETSPPPARAVG